MFVETEDENNPVQKYTDMKTALLWQTLTESFLCVCVCATRQEWKGKKKITQRTSRLEKSAQLAASLVDVLSCKGCREGRVDAILCRTRFL